MNLSGLRREDPPPVWACTSQLAAGEQIQEACCSLPQLRESLFPLLPWTSELQACWPLDLGSTFNQWPLRFLGFWPKRVSPLAPPPAFLGIQFSERLLWDISDFVSQFP